MINILLVLFAVSCCFFIGFYQMDKGKASIRVIFSGVVAVAFLAIFLYYFLALYRLSSIDFLEISKY
jgi:hypothetical protein